MDDRLFSSRKETSTCSFTSWNRTALSNVGSPTLTTLIINRSFLPQAIRWFSSLATNRLASCTTSTRFAQTAQTELCSAIKAPKIADGSIVTDPNISPNRKYFIYTKEVNGKPGVYLYNIKSKIERLLIGG